MTPKQLRYFTTIIRCGGVGKAADALGVSQAAVSASVASLRRELGDPLFEANRSGVVTTPGGQRLAHRAQDILGLQELTAREIARADNGRRLLRIASTSLFSEYAGPGLIDAVAHAFEDIDVEVISESSDRFAEALITGRAELAIGPRRSTIAHDQTTSEFFGCEVIAVADADIATSWQSAKWFIGPSAIESGGVCQFIMGRARIPSEQQRLCSSHSAAVAQSRRRKGIALVPSFAVEKSLSEGSLVRVEDARLHAAVIWTTYALAERVTSAARDVISLLESPTTVHTICSGGGVALERAQPLPLSSAS